MIIGLMIVCSFSPFTLSQDRSGTDANEPTDGFSEGNETIEIYHQNGDHDTNFNIGETVYIRINTTLVDALPNNDNDNRVRVSDYLGNKIGADHKPFFSAVGAGPPYIYDGSFVADSGNGFNTNDDYLIEVTFKGTTDQIAFVDVIHVGGASVPEEKHIKLYNDDTYTNETYDFSPTGTINVEVWTGANAVDNSQSSVRLLDYLGNQNTRKDLNTLLDPTVTEVGNYSRFSFNIPNDDDANRFTLQDGYWYSIWMTMNDGNSDLIVDWSAQFRIDHSLANPPVLIQGDTSVDPAAIIVGVDSTTISTTFTHKDGPTPDLFDITYLVKDESNTIYTLVDAWTNGQGGLVVTQDISDKTKYTITYNWSPISNQPLGLYDLYCKVDDKINAAEDVFVNNADELELLAPPGLPMIAAGDTTATPSMIKALGVNPTVISVNFTHKDGPLADSFKVTFRVRDPTNHQIMLVDAATTGSAGLTVIKTGNTTYHANFTWDPPDNAVLGGYDLFSRVEDLNGENAEDTFGQNAEELLLTKDPAFPKVTSGATSADPSSINRTGNEPTIISTQFHHDDMPGISWFQITYIVRDETNTNKTILDNKKHGFGGLNILDLGSGDYLSTISWDPSDDQPLGTYDLYFKVSDGWGNSAIDTFDANLEELTLTKKPTSPLMVAGVTNAEPASVNVAGNFTTKIETRFTHADIPPITSFFVTLKIRDVGNQETVLLNQAQEGTPGFIISDDGGGNFSASFIWDPPSINQPLGTYDLFASIVDGNGLMVQDGFNNNLEELTLVKEDIIPTNQTISGKVLDNKGEPIDGATVKIYNSSTGVVVKTLTTDANGAYSVELPTGTYDIGVGSPDHIGEVVKNKQLSADSPLTLEDFTLISTTGNTTNPRTVEKEVIPSYVIGLMIILIIIIVILLMLLSMKGRSGPTESMDGEHHEGHHSHQRTSEDVTPDHPIEAREKEEIDNEPTPISPKKVEIKPLEEDEAD